MPNPLNTFQTHDDINENDNLCTYNSKAYSIIAQDQNKPPGMLGNARVSYKIKACHYNNSFPTLPLVPWS